MQAFLRRFSVIVGLALGGALLAPAAFAEDDEAKPAADHPAAAAHSAAAEAASEHAPAASAALEHAGPAGSALAEAAGENAEEAKALAAAASANVDLPDDTGDMSKAEELEGNSIALGCHDEACTKKYAEYIERIVPKVKERVLEKLDEKIDEKQAKKMNTLSMALFGFSLTGFLLLLMPLFLAKKYPGKGGLIFKFSAVAAVATVVVLDLFAVVVLLIRTVQGVTSKFTNPQIQIVSAALDNIVDEADHLVTIGPQLIQPTLDQLLGSDDPVPVALLENVKTVVKDAKPFISIAQWFKGISWIFEYVPIVMTTIAVVVFVLGARPIVKELVALPARAAQGEDASAVVKEAFKRVGREFMAAGMMILCLIAVTMFSGEMLALAIRPAVASFLDAFFVNIVYVQQPEFNSTYLFASLGGTVVFLVLNVAVLIASSAIFIGKFHKIFQAKFQRNVPLGSHKKFWLWGTLGLIWAQAFPFLFAMAAEPLIEMLSDKAYAKDTPNWSLALLGGPAIYVLGFLVLFWAFRGIKAIVWTVKYKPEPAVTAEPAPVAKAA